MNQELNDAKNLNSQSQTFEEDLAKKKAELEGISKEGINYEANLSALAELKQNLPLMKERLERLKANIVAEPKRRIVEMDPELEKGLKEKEKELMEMESQVNALEESQLVRIKVHAMSPVLENLLGAIAIKTTTEEFAEQSLEKQKEALRNLEEQKLNLENLLGEMPLAEESAPLRERGKGMLGQLVDQIQRLGNLLGQKMAMAAQFLALRTDALKQLDEMNKKLAEEKRDVQNAERELADLEEMGKKLDELEMKLNSQLPLEEGLDVESRKELDEMKKSVENFKKNLLKSKQIIEVGLRNKKHIRIPNLNIGTNCRKCLEAKTGARSFGIERCPGQNGGTGPKGVERWGRIATDIPNGGG